MNVFKIRTAAEQVADHLREQVRRGAWVGEIPGAPALAGELGVDHRLIISAFSLLEKEGLLETQGVGRRRKITLRENAAPPALRLQIMPYEQSDAQQMYIVDLIHRLLELGHIAGLASRSLREMNMDVKQVARFVQSTEADAWVVLAGSREILEWFAAQPKPAFAFAGRRRRVPIAGISPDKVPALLVALRRLISLGHRRIVMLGREERRKPGPGFFEQCFLRELASHGIQTGPYNLPDWTNDIDDFHRCIESLFRHTPPTAILIDGMPLFIAAQQHLARIGILAPRDISMICLDPDPAFAWCQPAVTHISWDSRPLARRIIRWADRVARGKKDLRQNSTHAQFIEGGTIGPVRDGWNAI